MRARLGAVLLVLGIGLLGIPLAAAPASAAVMSVSTSNYHPVYHEVITVTGVATPIGRTVYLQRYYAGHGWHNYKVTRSRSHGLARFAVYGPSRTTYFRTYAPSLRYHGHFYSSRISRMVRISPATPSLTLNLDNTTVAQPVSAAASGADTTKYAMAEGRFYPARSGHAVALQVWGDDKAWHTVGTGRQTSSGTYRIPVPEEYLGTGSSPRTYRAYTIAGHAIASGIMTPTFYTSTFNDEFDGTTLNAANWGARTSPECSPSAENGQCKNFSKCMSVDTNVPANVSVSGGIASLQLRRTAADGTCPNGHWQAASIGTQTASPSEMFSHGVFAARVKVQHASGMHSAFWMQGDFTTGDELDAVEYYGDGTNFSGASTYVHHEASGLSQGGKTDVTGIVPSGQKLSDGWHIYSVSWTADRYVFRIDGTPVLITDQPHVATTPEEMVLSLTSPDWERESRFSGVDNMLNARMQVDWVRAWSY